MTDVRLLSSKQISEDDSYFAQMRKLMDRVTRCEEKIGEAKEYQHSTQNKIKLMEKQMS